MSPQIYPELSVNDFFCNYPHGYKFTSREEYCQNKFAWQVYDEVIKKWCGRREF